MRRPSQGDRLVDVLRCARRKLRRLSLGQRECVRKARGSRFNDGRWIWRTSLIRRAGLCCQSRFVREAFVFPLNSLS